MMLAAFTKILGCQSVAPTPALLFRRSLNKKPSLHREHSLVSLVKPREGCIKLNFDGSCKGRDRISSIGGVFRDHQGNFLLGYAQSIGSSNSTIAELVASNRGPELALENRDREHILVSWKKPREGCIKLNVDGSCKGRDRISSIGGVFRDHQGNFLLGYAQSIGSSNSTIAELVALMIGLELAWKKRWDVCLEGDAKTVVDVIVGNGEFRCVLAMKLARYIKLIMARLDINDLTHTYREGNRAADIFAQLGHQHEKLQIWDLEPPPQAVPVLRDDAAGKSFPRWK